MRKSWTGFSMLLSVVLLSCLTILSLTTLGSDGLEDWLSAPSAPTSGGYGEAMVGTDDGMFLVRCLYSSSQPEVYLYTQTNGWTRASTAGLETGMFRNGTALAWDSQDHIYALAGGRYKDTQRTEFLRYTISAGTWEHLKDTRCGQGAGDAISWSGFDGKVYAIIGSRSHNGERSSFMCYDPESDTWSGLPFIWENTDDGAALVWTGGEYLYALRGEYMETIPNGEFARYHIPTATWEVLPSLPDPDGVGDGGSLLYVSDSCDSIYALSGGAADESFGKGFFRFSITDNVWNRLADLPCPIGYYVGNRLAYSDGSIYYWQGGTKSAGCSGSAFYKVELATNTSLSTLIINEIEINPLGEDSGAEWIELYNPRAHPISLAGWEVTYTSYGGGVATLPAVTVPSKGYFVYTYMKRRLNNSSGLPIQLVDPDGTVVDATPPGLKDSSNDLRTWQRVPNGVDTDSFGDWRFRYGTPQAVN